MELAGRDGLVRLRLEPQQAVVCIDVPKSEHNAPECAADARKANSDLTMAVARVRHEDWSYVVSIVRERDTTAELTEATAPRAFTLMAEGFKPFIDGGVTIGAPKLTLLPSGVKTFSAPIDALSILPTSMEAAEHQLVFIAMSSSHNYVITFSGTKAHAAELDTEANAAIRTLIAAPTNALPVAANANWATYVFGAFALGVVVLCVVVFGLRRKRKA